MDNGTDFSINLPTWAYHLGYRLVGFCGTYDPLYLWKHRRIIRKFEWNKIPNIFEIEEIIDEVEKAPT